MGTIPDDNCPEPSDYSKLENQLGPYPGEPEWQSWEHLVEHVSSGKSPATVRTSSVLEYFGRERRGAIVNREINEWLLNHGLEMFPSIADADYYGNVRIQKRYQSGGRAPSEPASSNSTQQNPADSSPPITGMTDWVLSALKEDAEELDCLQYGDSVDEALKLMDEHKRSKLPMFFSKSDRSTLVGTVTLRDLTFENTSSSSKLIDKATTHVPVVGTNEKLFDWIPSILTHGFIYGKNIKGEIVQIYTTSDVARHLNAITAMFLRANELEELLREALSSVTQMEIETVKQSARHLTDIYLDEERSVQFTRDEITVDGQSEDESRPVEKLDFAGYMKCVADSEIWQRELSAVTEAGFDKEQCIRSLNDARLARNKVMHFTRSDALENLIPSFEAPAVWLRKVVAFRRSKKS